jgi:hypothetical protein
LDSSLLDLQLDSSLLDLQQGRPISLWWQVAHL